MTEDCLWRIVDDRDRPLVLQRRVNDQVIFIRYPDMTEDDKDIIRCTWNLIKEMDSEATDPNGNQLGDIESFLNFTNTSEDICG